MMRAGAEAGLFLTLAAAVHAAAWIGLADGGAPASGRDSAPAVASVAAADAEIAAMVDAWKRPPDALEVPPDAAAPRPEAAPRLLLAAAAPPVRRDAPTLPEAETRVAPAAPATAAPTLAAPAAPAADPSAPGPEAVAAVPPRPPAPPAPRADAPPRPDTATDDGGLALSRSDPPRLRPSSVQSPARATATRSAAQASAPSPASTAAGAAPPAAPAMSAERRASVLAGWGAEIRARIEPRARRLAGGRGGGDAVVLITVTRDGALSAASLAATSGDGRFDAAALQAVRAAGRFPAAPKGLSDPAYSFRLPIRRGG